MFEEMSGGEIVKFDLRLVADGKAELTILDVSVRIKPVQFVRQ